MAFVRIRNGSSLKDSDVCFTTTTITSITSINAYRNSTLKTNAYTASRVSANSNSVISTKRNNYKNGTQSKQIDEFLQHIRTKHRPTLMPHQLVNTSDIGVQVGKYDRTVDSIEKILNTKYNATHDKSAPYDLTTLSKSALLDVINVLKRCACLWHKPTQHRVGYKESLYAYQLILRKLREYQKTITLWDVRNIVQQLMNDFQKILNAPHSKRPSPSYAWALDTSIRKLEPATSRKVLGKLMFLTFDKDKDLRHANISKLCCFCNKSFSKYDDLWSHMKTAHISQTNLCKPVSVVEINDENLFINNSYVNNNSATSLIVNVGKETGRKLHKRKRKVLRFQRNNANCDTTSGESDMEIKPLYYLNQYSDDFLLRFIESLRQKECLWNVNSEAYQNRHKKEKAYKELLRECHEMVSDHDLPNILAIKNVIRHLKYYYKRHRSCKAKRRVSRHHIWQNMAFIDDSERPQYRRRRHNHRRRRRHHHHIYYNYHMDEQS